MARTTIDGAEIRYEVLGDKGPWCLINPGGRFDLDAARPHARWLVDGGYRVIIYDRRNIGASDVWIGPQATEDEIFADDMAALAALLDTGPLFLVAAGGGNRPAMDFALRYPELTRGYACVFPSGGQRAVPILAQMYYSQYADAAEADGMRAVCETDYYRERIEANPRNRELLEAMDPTEFAATMRRWADGILASADLPTTNFTAKMLERITAPTLVFPGLLDDHIHGYESGMAVAQAIPGARIVQLAEDRKPADDDGSWIWRGMRKRMSDPDLGRAMLAFLDELVASEGLVPAGDQ